jgi:hypothetical protein
MARESLWEAKFIHKEGLEQFLIRENLFILHKVGGLMWSLLNQTPIFQGYKARLVVKNGHQRDISN